MLENDVLMSHKEYRVLKTIKNIVDKKGAIDSTLGFVCKEDISLKIKYKEYELNEIIRSLANRGYITNIFNEDDANIHGTTIIDAGRVALKYYHINFIKYLFEKYIWVIIISALTAFLTAYFTCKFM